MRAGAADADRDGRDENFDEGLSDEDDLPSRPPPPDPRGPLASRYPLLDRLTVTEIGPDELEILFRGGGGGGEKENGGEGGEEGGEEEENTAAAAVTAVAPCVVSSSSSSSSSSSPAAAAAAAAAGSSISRIVICPCSATEVKGAIMRMLTRLHLEREFRVGSGGGGGGV